MSLYPVSTDRHVSFAAQEDTYDNRLWQQQQQQQHHPHNIPYDDTDFSFWQSTSSRPPPVHYNTPDLPFHNFYRPTPYQPLTDFHPSPQHLSLLPLYPDSSHRSYVPSGHSSLSPALSAASSISKPSSIDQAWTNSLYYIDDEEHTPDFHQPSTSSVKAEPDETFIMELRAPSSDMLRDNHSTSSHVPLRATHASGEMLSMMGVFRLDPFIVRGAAWQQEENTGLTQSPTMFEFSVELPEETDVEEEEWSLEEEEVDEPLPDLLYPRRDDFPLHDYYRDSYSDYNRPVRGS